MSYFCRYKNKLSYEQKYIFYRTTIILNIFLTEILMIILKVFPYKYLELKTKLLSSPGIT